MTNVSVATTLVCVVTNLISEHEMNIGLTVGSHCGHQPRVQRVARAVQCQNPNLRPVRQKAQD